MYGKQPPGFRSTLTLTLLLSHWSGPCMCSSCLDVSKISKTRRRRSGEGGAPLLYLSCRSFQRRAGQQEETGLKNPTVCAPALPWWRSLMSSFVLQEEASARREADWNAPSPLRHRSLWCMNVPLPTVGRSCGASGAGGQGGTADGSSFLLHRFRPHLSNMLKKYLLQEKLQLTASLMLPKENFRDPKPGSFWSAFYSPELFSHFY